MDTVNAYTEKKWTGNCHIASVEVKIRECDSEAFELALLPLLVLQAPHTTVVSVDGGSTVENMTSRFTRHSVGLHRQ